MKLKCPKCGYEWDYKGRMTYYATCPNCKRPVRIKDVRGRGRGTKKR